jgi:hypothetical protein
MNGRTFVLCQELQVDDLLTAGGESAEQMCLPRAGGPAHHHQSQLIYKTECSKSAQRWTTPVRKLDTI